MPSFREGGGGAFRAAASFPWRPRRWRRREAAVGSLHALDDLGPLPVELHEVLVKGLLLAVLQVLALVVLEEPVVVAVVAVAKGAVAGYPLGGGLALVEAALDLAGRHGGGREVVV